MRRRRYRRYRKSTRTPNRSDVQLYNLQVAALQTQLHERMAIIERLDQSVRTTWEAKLQRYQHAVEKYSEWYSLWVKLKSQNSRINREIAHILTAAKEKQGSLARMFCAPTLSPAATARVEELKKCLVEIGPEPIPPAPVQTSLTADEKLLAEHLHYVNTWLGPAITKAAKREAREQRKREKQERAAAKTALMEAAAAAHLGKTRDLADQIKKTLRDQIAVFPDCPYCFGTLGVQPHADHIFPVSRGGLSTADNMVLICSACNLKKSDKTLREFIRAYQLDQTRIEAVLELFRKRF